MKYINVFTFLLILISCESKDDKIKNIHQDIKENMTNNDKIDDLMKEFEDLDNQIKSDTNSVYKLDKEKGLIEDK